MTLRNPGDIGEVPDDPIAPPDPPIDDGPGLPPDDPKPPPPPPDPPPDEPPPDAPGDGGGPNPGGTGRQDLLERVRITMPWIPGPLRRIYVNAWIETGDPDLAYAIMQDDPLYDRYFAGNRREDGSFRFSEQDYQRQIEHYDQSLRQAGLNPQYFRKRYGELIAGEVSGDEWDFRIAAFRQRVQLQGPAIREAMMRLYGIRMSDAAILGGLLDPEIDRALIERRLSVAEIGGAAIDAGFRIRDISARGGDNVEAIERLIDFGVTENTARDLFATAAGQLPMLDTLAKRHFDPDDTFDLAEFLEASAFGDADEIDRIRRLLNAESTLFSPTGGTVRTSRVGALTGLEAR